MGVMWWGQPQEEVLEPSAGWAPAGPERQGSGMGNHRGILSRKGCGLVIFSPKASLQGDWVIETKNESILSALHHRRLLLWAREERMVPRTWAEQWRW